VCVCVTALSPSCLQAERPPSLLSPSVQRAAPDTPPQEPRAASALSPLPPQPEPPQESGGDDSGEAGPEDSADTPSTDPPTPSYPPWVKSPERGGLPFTFNSNLRDLTPSHTLDQGSFRPDTSEGALYYPSPEEGAALGFPRALGDAGAEGGSGNSQTPPQKKKVSLLEYRKRQKEARRSGSRAECGSPVSAAPPLVGLCSAAVEACHVTTETAPEAPQPCEVTETPPQGEREGRRDSGHRPHQWRS
ncbi:hypothetical protein AAFF_G00061510, partial [Aldrovandia affinis]